MKAEDRNGEMAGSGCPGDGGIIRDRCRPRPRAGQEGHEGGGVRAPSAENTGELADDICPPIRDACE